MREILRKPGSQAQALTLSAAVREANARGLRFVGHKDGDAAAQGLGDRRVPAQGIVQLRRPAGRYRETLIWWARFCPSVSVV